MEGVHQIAVRILTLTWIFSSIFDRNFDLFFRYLKKYSSTYIESSNANKKAYLKKYAFKI
jgi:hypothetical protein